MNYYLRSSLKPYVMGISLYNPDPILWEANESMLTYNYKRYTYQIQIN